jgi:hypothetical protein
MKATITGSTAVTAGTPKCFYPVMDVGPTTAINLRLDLKIQVATDIVTPVSEIGSYPVEIPGVSTFMTLHTISGNIYDTAEGTVSVGASLAISLRTSAGITATSTLAATLGAFSFAIPSLADGDVVTIWLTGAKRAVLVFKYGSSCTGYSSNNCTGLVTYENRLRLASYNGTAFSNADMAFCDDDTNCATNGAINAPGFTSNSNNLVLTSGMTKISIPSGTTYAPGGNVTATTLSVYGTYTAGSETLTLSGGADTTRTCTADNSVALCIAVGGTFTSSAETFVYTGGASRGWYIGGTGSVYNLTVQGSIDGSAEPITVAHAFTVAGGGSYSPTTAASGISMLNGSTVTCTGTCSFQLLSISGAVSSTGNLAVKSGLNVATGAAFTAGNTVTMQSAMTQTGTGTTTFTNLTLDSAGATCGGGTATQKRVNGVLTLSNGLTATCANMTMGDGSSIVNGGTLTVNGMVIDGAVTTANDITLGAATFTVNSGAHFTQTAGALLSTSTGNITVTSGGSMTLNNLTHSYSASRNIIGDLSVNGIISNTNATGDLVFSGGTLTMNNGSSIANSGDVFDIERLRVPAGATLTANTNFTITASAGFGAGSTFSPSSGTVTFDTGSAIENSGGTVTLSGMALNTSAAVAASGSFAVSGTLTANAGSVLTPTTATIISGSGTLTGAGTVAVSRVTGANDFAGQYTIANKTLSGLTVDFTGTGQGIDNLSYGTLKMSGSTTVPATFTATTLTSLAAAQPVLAQAAAQPVPT